MLMMKKGCIIAEVIDRLEATMKGQQKFEAVLEDGRVCVFLKKEIDQI